MICDEVIAIFSHHCDSFLLAIGEGGGGVDVGDRLVELRPSAGPMLNP